MLASPIISISCDLILPCDISIECSGLKLFIPILLFEVSITIHSFCLGNRV